MFDVVSTLVVIDTSKGKIKSIAIDKPTFVVLSNFLMFFIFFSFSGELPPRFIIVVISLTLLISYQNTEL